MKTAYPPLPLTLTRMPEQSPATTPAPRFRWRHPHAWLQTASASWSRDRLLHELDRLALQCGFDTIQDLYQEDMVADGYFEPHSQQV